ncbi:MAG: hypothetical protein AB7G75_24115 [Candidatus Binatia bacterium]
MAKELTVQEQANVRSCLEVLRAVQKNARTPGWFRGEVRGQEAVGVAVATLQRKGLIQAGSGPQPFRLSKTGKDFVAENIKDWDAFMAKSSRPSTLEKIAKALQRVSASGK